MPVHEYQCDGSNRCQNYARTRKCYNRRNLQQNRQNCWSGRGLPVSVVQFGLEIFQRDHELLIDEVARGFVRLLTFGRRLIGIRQIALAAILSIRGVLFRCKPPIVTVIGHHAPLAIVGGIRPCGECSFRWDAKSWPKSA